MKNNDNGAPTYGWDAITETFESIYPGQTDPLHYRPIISYMLGGNDPLEGVSVYDGGDFWHFVTYGFSNLYENEDENEDAQWSGSGFELTLKLKKIPSVVLSETEDLEIKNIVGVLQGLARYVFSSGKGFYPYEYIYTKQENGFDAHQQSKLTGFATLPDIAGTIDTPNGKVEFVCIVGLTDKELKSIYEGKQTIREILELLNSDLTDYSREDVI